MQARLTTEKLIGTGLTSEVISWGEERVLKLFLPLVTAASVQREFTVSRAIHAAGVPIPAVFEILQIGQRHGIVFEWVRGHSLLKQVELKPWTLFAAARQLAELHARVHAYPALAGLPAQREQIERWINGADDFSDAGKELARRHIAKLPPGNCLCHGDFHPANILLTPRGPMIIDWSDATCGHALADVARTSVLFESADLPRETSLQVRLLMKVVRRLLHSAYLRRYLELRPGTLDEIERWRVPQRLAGAAWRAERRAAITKAAT